MRDYLAGLVMAALIERGEPAANAVADAFAAADRAMFIRGDGLAACAMPIGWQLKPNGVAVKPGRSAERGRVEIIEGDEISVRSGMDVAYAPIGAVVEVLRAFGYPIGDRVRT